MKFLQIYGEPTDYTLLWVVLIIASLIWFAVIYWLISSATKAKEITLKLGIQNNILAEIARKHGVEDKLLATIKGDASLEVLLSKQFNNILIGKHYDHIKAVCGEAQIERPLKDGSKQRDWSEGNFSITVLFDKEDIFRKVVKRKDR